MVNLIQAFWKVIIRTSAFVRKEISILIRQPQLLMTLVLGPFLIMLIFGVGYRNEAPVLETLFVAQPGSEVEEQINAYAPTLGEQLAFKGVTGDLQEALNQLQTGGVDLVVVAPTDPLASIKAGEQAEFQLYHTEIDPFQASYINYFGEIYIDEVNRRVLQAITAQGQVEAVDLQQDLAAAKQNTQAIEQALDAGDEAASQQYTRSLSNNLDNISLAMGASLALMNRVETMVGSQAEPHATKITALREQAQALDREMTEQPGAENSNQWKTRVKEISAGLDDLETQLETFTQLEPALIVKPFASSAKSVTTLQPDATSFYAPAVIALLLQHLAVTIAALSIVHERHNGTLELFRVSPLTAAEMLVGKYLSYMLFGAIVAGALLALVHLGLRIPMLGHWANYALVIGVLLFTSLGIGFVISLISRTDSQAVQYTMMVLLISVFFSGFLMNLNYFIEPVRSLSWGIPTTYGISLLRDIALRGSFPNMTLIGILAFGGLALYIVAWLILRRSIAASR